MKRLPLVIATVFAFCCVNAAQAEGTIRYFAGVAGVISPLLEFSPKGALSAEKAKDLNHYVVRYDAQNRLSSLKYFKQSEASSDSYFYAHEVRYTYGEGRRTRSYFGTAGEPQAMSRHYYRSDNVQREEYILDGNKTTLHMYGLDGERVEAGTGTYVFEGEILEGRGLIQRLYRKDGSAGIIFNYLPFEVSLLTLDENGYIYQILNFDESTGAVIMHEAAGFAEMRIKFDEFGNELGWDIRDTAGNLVNRSKDMEDGGHAIWTYEFEWIDRSLGQYSGYIQRYFTADSVPFCKGGAVCAQKLQFNRRDNVTRIENWGPSDVLVLDPVEKVAKVEIEYDKQGRRLESRYYGADAKLRTVGVAVRRYSYDQHGAQVVLAYDHLENKVTEN